MNKKAKKAALKQLRQLRLNPAVTDAEGKVHIFEVHDPTPSTKVRKLFRKLLRETEEANPDKPPLTSAEKTALKKNEAVIARLNIRRKHEIRGTHAVRDRLFNPNCRVGLHIRGYITSKRRIDSAFMDAEGNFFEVKPKEFQERAAWAMSHPDPPSLDYKIVRPVLTGKPIHIKPEVRIKVEKFAKTIFPLFIETLDAE
jgi:hypothetical protein